MAIFCFEFFDESSLIFFNSENSFGNIQIHIQSTDKQTIKRETDVMNLPIFKKFPSSVRYGFLSGATTSIVTTFLVGLFAIIATVLESRENIFTYSFQNSFMPYFFTIQVVFILFWVSISAVLSVFLVSQNEKESYKSILIFTNTLASFFSYLLTSIPLMLLFLVFDMATGYFFRK